MNINFFEEWVNAWFSSFVWEDDSYKVSIEDYLIKRPLTTIWVRVMWESMKNVWILPWDIALVDTSLTPKRWDIVIAIIDWLYSIKFFEKDSKSRFFLTSNSGDCYYPKDELKIFWIVTSVIRKYL